MIWTMMDDFRVMRQQVCMASPVSATALKNWSPGCDDQISSSCASPDAAAVSSCVESGRRKHPDPKNDTPPSQDGRSPREEGGCSQSGGPTRQKGGAWTAMHAVNLPGRLMRSAELAR